jgi:uncharacterized membrane protein
MTEFLFLVMIIFGVIIFDLRSRLARLEQLVHDGAVPSEREQWRPAVIVDRPIAPPLAVEVEPDVPAAYESVEQVAQTAPIELEPTPQVEDTLDSSGSVWTAADPDEDPRGSGDDQRTSSGFEDLFGRKLPIWAGGITLVVAAVLLVKYSIDAGLLSPAVRVMLGAFFGAGLIGGAEIARRKAHLVQDDRIAQALAGAGVGSLYAATLAANNLYALLSPGTAFVGLSAITALAMGLSLRFGAPTAVLGLIGGLATPALVSSGEPNVPLLAGYLALVAGGLTVLSRRQRWFWLGVSALAGGGVWTALLVAFGSLDQASTLAIGFLVLVLGLALPMFASADRRGPILRAVAAVVASMQLALLVATGGYAMLSWGLYALLSLAFIWLAMRMPALRATIAVPLITSLMLAATWPAPLAGQFIAVMAGIILTFGGSALWRLWRVEGALRDAGQIVLTALGGFFVSYWQYRNVLPGGDTGLALIALGFALLPVAGAALGWSREERRDDLRFATLVLSSGLLVVSAAILGLAEWTIPVAGVIIAAGLLMIAEKAQDHWIRHGALVYLGVALLALLGTGAADIEVSRLAVAMPFDPSAQALLRWASAFAVTALFSWRFLGSLVGMVVQGTAAILAYGLVAQGLPTPWLAIAAAAGMLFATEATRRTSKPNLQVALIVLAAIAGLWALEPLARWLLAAMASLAGRPVLVGDLSSLPLALQRLLGPALIGAVALWRMRERLAHMAGIVVTTQISVIALVGVHILYKQLFAMNDMDGFVHFGLAERTLWQALLIGAGLVLWRLVPERKEALALVGLGLAHNLYYSLFLYDPLWARQAVGPWPFANLLLPAFAISFAGPILIERIAPALKPRLQLPAAIARMIVILLFAFASLRQLFSGSILVDADVGSSENILRSVLAIALAVGYLLWGIRSGQRAWRIGSLLLMLVAVAKVFLFDASGLEGLLRIAAFLSLGFSLIGIGWLYSRYLKPDLA